MTEQIRVWVPCDVYAVKVRTAAQAHLSELEVLFLSAVLRGLSDINELREFFGIGKRPVLDLVFDLWQKGYLLVDIENGVILPAGHLDENKIAELETAEVEMEDRLVLLDLVTGSLQRERIPGVEIVSRVPWQANCIVPTTLFRVERREITSDRLIRVMNDILANEQARHMHSRKRKVLSAHLALSTDNRLAQSKWLGLDIDCWLDEDLDAFTINFINCPLSQTTQHRLAKALSRIASDMPETVFAKLLRSKANKDRRDQRTFEWLINQIRTEAARLQDVDRGNRRITQERLECLADQVDAILCGRNGFDAELELIFAQDDHQRLVEELISNAKRQIVISCPWMGFETLTRISPKLVEALDREPDLRIFLLWGFNPADDLEKNDPAVNNYLTGLRDEYPDRFFISRQSSRIHGKTIVIDMDAAVVTSLNIMSPSKNITLECGLLVQPIEHGSALLEDILAWLFKHYPDYESAQQMMCSSEDFGFVGIIREPPSLPRGVPPLADHELLEPLDLSAVKLWRESWFQYSDLAQTALTDLEAKVRVVVDGDHRMYVQAALRNAKRRLVLCSDRMSTDVLGVGALNRLRERLDDGVVVVFVYRRLSRNDARNLALIEQLNALEASHQNFTLCNANNHAKLVVHDDLVVVSSLNFLSFGAEYEDDLPSRRRQIRSELGLAVTNSEIANQIVVQLEQFTQHKMPRWEEHYTEPAIAKREAIPLRAKELQRLLTGLSDTSSAEGGGALTDVQQIKNDLTDYLLAHDSPLECLEQIERARFPQDLLIHAVRTVLGRRARADTGDVKAENWWRWLAEIAWQRNEFSQAAMYAAPEHAEASEILPSAPLLLLGVWVETASDSHLHEIVDACDFSDEELGVVAAVAMLRFMISGAYELRELADPFISALPSHWVGLVAQYDSYWNETYLPLPLAAIEREQKQSELATEIEAAWNHLDDAVEKVSRTHFKFQSGTAIHGWLFDIRGPYGRLRAILNNRDADGLIKWLVHKPHDGPWVDKNDELIDFAGKAADRLGRSIGLTKRVVYVRHLDDIVHSAKHIAELVSSTGQDEKRRLQLTHARSFANFVHTHWDVLLDELRDLPRGGERITKASLAPLQKLQRWVAT